MELELIVAHCRKLSDKRNGCAQTWHERIEGESYVLVESSTPVALPIGQSNMFSGCTAACMGESITDWDFKLIKDGAYDPNSSVDT